MDKRQELQLLFETAVHAAHPERCLTPYLPEIPDVGRLVVLGAGKACSAMVQVLEAHYASEGVAEELSGAAVTRHGYKLGTRFIPVQEAGHPVPDVFSQSAAAQALEIANGCGENDTIVVLLSGGASALWSAPLPGISLEDKQEITRGLLRSGATIEEINCVRKHLSLIKGGRLTAAAYPARVITLAISDVPHDDISSIGSGPTVGDPTSCAEALTILDSYDVKTPELVRSMLMDGSAESLFSTDDVFSRSEYHLIATPNQSLRAASDVVKVQGYDVVMLGDSLEGEARDVAREHARLALEAKAQGRKTAFVSGGELTVTIRGEGTGGPNQEYALALACALEGSDRIWAFSGDTDGVDGGSGSADDPAGAFVGPDTLGRAAQAGADPVAYLQNNDSGGFFHKLGDLHVCGGTQTNVNDFRVILVDP